MEIRIYVACLSLHNAGIHHGEWIGANQPADDIRAAISAMLAKSTKLPHGEYAIHDYEGFGKIKLSEYEDIDNVSRLAELLEEHGELFGEVYDHCGDIDEAIEAITDRYRGKFDSLEDYAAEFVGECYSDAIKNLPDIIRNHIDYESIGRDFEIGGDVWTIEMCGKVHVFDSY